ncbi:glycerol-3-phosphate dehydrogenase subunit GlpB [Desulfotomaculum defluvii]
MMKKNVDVLVIGAGLSGLIAAAKAADYGKKILVVAKGMGALGLSSGCIDLWGYSIDQPDEFCQRPIDEIAQLISNRPDHPYAKVADVLVESLDFFEQLCTKSDIYYRRCDTGNWQLPTALGTLRPTYLAPAGMAVENLARVKNILIIGFQALKDFYPDVLAENLKKNMNLHGDCHITTLMLDLDAAELTPNNLAYLLEKQDILQRLVSYIKPHLQEDMVILMPPVLGERWDSKVRPTLMENLGVSVYEVANIPPSLPGQRLQQALLHHLRRRGVEIILGCTVTEVIHRDGRCTEVMATGSGKQLKIISKNIILGTGSFLGGGLEAEPGEVIEPIFNLPVKTYEGKRSSSQFLSKEGHPFNKFGIEVNDRLQPVNGWGEVVLENVMVVGSNVAGCNVPVEKCGNGVALTTGYKAGKLAGEV